MGSEAQPRRLIHRDFDLSLSFACAVVLVICLLISKPFVEMGVNDDWSYIWIARTLAQTGHIIYNGWASSMLGWQLYWGALFIRVFGFSFTVTRVSILFIAMLTTVLVHRIFRRIGINRWNATWATLMVATSALFFPLAFSFMTDVPGLFALLVCLYCCLRAIQTQNTMMELLWLILAAGSNVLLGTVRQISWLGVIVLVPSTLWILRRRSRLLRYAVSAVWIVSVFGIDRFILWFNAQPYTLAESILAGSAGPHSLAMRCVSSIRSLFVMSALLLPVSVGFLTKSPAWLKGGLSKYWTLLTAVFVTVITLLLLFSHWLKVRHKSMHDVTPFSNNLLTSRGFVDLPDLLGSRPDVVPLGIRILIFSLIACCFVAMCMWTADRMKRKRPPIEDSATSMSEHGYLTALLGPLTIGYMLLFVTRANQFDRYLLPMLIIAICYLLRFYQIHVQARLPIASIVLVTLFAGFSVASMHDLFALDRARLKAANQLIATGLSRSEFRAGFEYDSWTQLQQNGHINDPRIHLPIGAFHDLSSQSYSLCSYWFSRETPDVHARYGLVYEPEICSGAVTYISPVKYSTWLGPHERELYIQKFPVQQAWKNEQ